MKNILLTILIASLLVVFSACKSSGGEVAPPSSEALQSSTNGVKSEIESQSTSSESEVPEQIVSDEGGGISVDKGLIDVELTLPASLMGDDIPTELTEEDKANGFKSFKVNDDGSVTYKISKSKHNELVKTLYDETSANLDKLANGVDFKSVKEVKHNKDFSEITITVDKAAYENSFDAFAIMGAGLAGSMYQVFAGVQQDKLHVEIQVQDESTSEILTTTIYPDALNSQ